MKTFAKKISGLVMTLIMVFTLSAPLMAHAQGPSGSGATPPQTNNVSGPSPDELFNTGTSTAGSTSKIGIVGNLYTTFKNASWSDILAGIVKFILAITGALAFVSFTYAGVMMVTARGNEEQIKKGKDILLWSIIALAIIATSYSLVLGVSLLKFS